MLIVSNTEPIFITVKNKELIVVNTELIFITVKHKELIVSNTEPIFITVKNKELTLPPMRSCSLSSRLLLLLSFSTQLIMS